MTNFSGCIKYLPILTPAVKKPNNFDDPLEWDRNLTSIRIITTLALSALASIASAAIFGSPYTFFLLGGCFVVIIDTYIVTEQEINRDAISRYTYYDYPSKNILMFIAGKIKLVQQLVKMKADLNKGGVSESLLTMAYDNSVIKLLIDNRLEIRVNRKVGNTSVDPLLNLKHLISSKNDKMLNYFINKYKAAQFVPQEQSDLLDYARKNNPSCVKTLEAWFAKN